MRVRCLQILHYSNSNFHFRVFFYNLISEGWPGLHEAGGHQLKVTLVRPPVGPDRR